MKKGFRIVKNTINFKPILGSKYDIISPYPSEVVCDPPYNMLLDWG